MSTGPFLLANYASALTGNVHPIKIQPETAQLSVDGVQNAIPAGPADDPRQAIVSRRRGIGLFAAKVGFRVTVAGTSGFPVGSIHYIPWLNATTLAGVVAPKYQPAEYQGATGRIIGYSPERLG